MGITISNSQRLWLGFSLWKITPQHMWVMWVVWVGIGCIRYDKLAKQNVSRAFLRDTWENQLSSFVLTLHIPIMCWAHASLRRKATREIPTKTSLVFNCLKSSHSLSHTTLTMKTHIKFRVQKIEQNYNQIWHEIIANTK